MTLNILSGTRDFAEDEEVLQVDSQIGVRWKESGPEEGSFACVVGPVGRLLPEHVGQSDEPELFEVFDDSGVVRVEVEDAVGGPGCVSDVDTRNAARDEHSSDFSPSLVEIL